MTNAPAQCRCFALPANSAKLAQREYIAAHYMSMTRPTFIRTHQPPHRNTQTMVETHSKNELYQYALGQMSYAQLGRVPISYTKTQLAALGIAAEHLRLRSIIARDMIMEWVPIEPLFRRFTNVCPDVLQIIRLYCGIMCLAPRSRKRRRLRWVDIELRLSMETLEWR